MPYAYLTWAQLQTEFLTRLSDPSANFWDNASSVPEIQLYLKEALRTWNAFTNYYRARAYLTVGSASAFYDVSAALDVTTGVAVRPYTVKDTDLLNAITYQLMEPLATGGVWAGSDQFTILDVQNAIQRRRNQFLLESGALLAHLALAVVSPPALGRVTLSDTVEKIVRAAWQDSVTGVWVPLGLEDEYAFQAFSNTWNQNTAPDPLAISISAVAPLVVQFAPSPSNNGNLDVVAIVSGADCNLSVGVSLGIPDDFTWVVKYGALADLLGKEGQAKDPVRAAYCEQRWIEGIELARLSTAVMRDSFPAYFVNQQLNIEDIQDLDRYFPGWQGLPAAAPQALALMGMNLLAIVPPLAVSTPTPIVLPDTGAGHWVIGVNTAQQLTLTATGASLTGLILTDSGGQNWNITVDAFGRFVQTATGTPGVASTLVVEPVSGAVFSLKVLPSGQLQYGPTTFLNLDVVRNAPIPTLAGDLVQIGREDLDAILDYAQDLACFKQGAEAMQVTAGHYRRFKRVAALHNERLRKSTIFWDQPDDLSRIKEVPREADQVVTGG